MGAEPVKWTSEEIRGIVKDYIRNCLMVSVDMVWNGDYYNDRQVPRVTIYLYGDEVTQATAY